MVFKLVCLTALLISSVVSRKSYLVKSEHNLKMQPKVQASSYACQECWFKNDDDEACVDYEWAWSMGWNWY